MICNGAVDYRADKRQNHFVWEKWRQIICSIFLCGLYVPNLDKNEFDPLFETPSQSIMHMKHCEISPFCLVPAFLF